MDKLQFLVLIVDNDYCGLSNSWWWRWWRNVAMDNIHSSARYRRFDGNLMSFRWSTEPISVHNCPTLFAADIFRYTFTQLWGTIGMGVMPKEWRRVKEKVHPNQKTASFLFMIDWYKAEPILITFGKPRLSIEKNWTQSLHLKTVTALPCETQNSFAWSKLRCFPEVDCFENSRPLGLCACAQRLELR